MSNTIKLWHQLKGDRKPVTIIGWDSAGENKKLQARLQSKGWKIPLQFEHMVSQTPQQQNMVENAFETL